ncbi:rna-directed dna polymerase from mobile element jockey-like [Pitangus sulphuratus]|nr:rna-directed dna polymerase from mobile element jockey-like [Pitangus sulphuratus]
MGLQQWWMREGQLTSSTWTCANHLTLSCITSLSINQRDIDLMDCLVDKILAGWSHQRIAVNGSMSKWRSVTSGVPHGPSLLNIFVSDMDGGMECIPSKFADNTKMCSAVSMLEGRNGIQRDLERLERRDCVNLMKFKAKCKVLNLGWGNPKHKLRREWIESSLGEKAWGCSWARISI